MPENDLSITLKLIDEATAPMAQASNRIKGHFEDVERKGNSAGKTIKEQFKEAGKELRDFRQTVGMAAAALGLIIVSARAAADYNKEAKNSFDKFTTSLTAFAATIGTAVSPALDFLSAGINNLRDLVEAFVAGFIKAMSFVYESFGALKAGFENIISNMKNIFTGKEDPLGVIEGFKVSFGKAMDIANSATDEFLNKMETTRAKVEGGVTLKSEATQVKNEEEIKRQQKTKTAKMESELKVQALADSKSLLADLAKENKAFAVLNQGVAIVESIINTSVGVTKALSSANIPLAIAIGAIGAAKTALIASQKFAEGSPNVQHHASGTDTVPAMLTPGEMVFPRTMADAIRNGDISVSGRGGGEGIQVNVYGGNFNSRDMIRTLAEEIGFEIDRKLRGARSFV